MANEPRAWTIGVDVGGTKIAAAAVDPVRGVVAHRREIATGVTRGPREVLEDLAALTGVISADLRREGGAVAGIGIGIPELVDEQGRIRSAYLFDWTAISLSDRLSEIASVHFTSDVRAAAAAEAQLGAGRSYRQLVYVSIGTGISSTLVQDGVPLAGARGGALVLSTAPLGVPCTTCGAWNDFVLEDFSSGRALAQRYGEASGRPIESAQQVVLAAADGDRHARAVVESAAHALGSSVAWLVNVLDPEALVIGGGLGLSGGIYWERLVTTTRSHIWNDEARGLPILPAALGADAGLIGAALTVQAVRPFSPVYSCPSLAS